MIVLDTETTGLDPRKCKPTHIGLYDGKKFTMHDDATCSGCFWTNVDAEKKYIMHNGKFDTLMLWWAHQTWIPWTYDTMLLSQLYDSRQRHSLDNLGQLYVGEGKYGDKKTLQAIKKGEFWMLPQEVQEMYLKRDCTLTWKLFDYFRKNLREKLWDLYNTFDLPVSLALARIETHGFTIDEELLKKYKEKLSDELEEVAKELGVHFEGVNINSPKQLLPRLKQLSGTVVNDTSERTIESLSKYVPQFRVLLRYRVLKKYLSTYVEGIEKHLWNGKVYPQFNLAGDTHAAGTQTGRTSSSNPNLQNQPRPNSGPVGIRNLFIASPGNVLLAADYSQLELKVAAYLSGDTDLLEGDIHAQAAKVLGVDRQIGKTCNFALLYGAGFNKIYATTGGSRNAEKYIRWFKEKFPKAIKWVDKQRERVVEEGRIETYLGRVRYMDSANAGANSCIQGSAGDIGKEATLRVHEAGYKVLGLIHDEVLLEVPKQNLEEAINDVPELMTTGLVNHKDIIDKTNMSVSVKVGENWGSMKDVQIKSIV